MLKGFQGRISAWWREEKQDIEAWAILPVAVVIGIVAMILQIPAGLRLVARGAIADLKRAPWRATFRRHPFLFLLWLAVCAGIVWASASFRDPQLAVFWVVALVMLTAWVLQSQKQVLRFKPIDFEPVPWRGVIGWSVMIGALIGPLLQWMFGAPVQAVPWWIGGGVAVAVTLGVEGEHWKRNGYARFPHLWAGYSASSVGAVLLTLALGAVGYYAAAFLLALFPITPDVVNWLCENLGGFRIKPNLLRGAADISGGTVLALGALTGASIGWRRRVWLSDRRRLRGKESAAETGEALAATLQTLVRLVAFARGFVIISFVVVVAVVAVSARAELESLALAYAAQYQIPYADILVRVLLGFVVLLALTLFTQGLVALLRAYSPPPALKDEKLGNARLARPADLRRSGIIAP